MRQLFVQLRPEAAARAARLADAHGAMHTWRLPAETDEGPATLLVAHLPNEQVGPFVAALGEFEDEVRVTFQPEGVLAFGPPRDEPAEAVTDVTQLSAIEVLLSGLQSIGSLKGFVGYAVAAGFVAWIGLFRSTIYLLTASMLIAPFAGPAMNAALGTAAGRTRLLRRSLGRYALGLALTAATAAVLSLVMRQDVATPLMVSVGQVSAVSVLLPLVAGAAGALHLVQSRRDSLVSGAAVGVLVAASLAPPTALAGMAAVLGEWAMVKGAVFILLLQLVGIHLSGTIAFRAFGVSPSGIRFGSTGRRAVLGVGLAVSAAALVGLLAWQFSSSPELERASRAQRATYEMREAVNESGLARPVEVTARFTRADIPGQHTLLGVAFVQRAAGVALPDSAIAGRLTRRIQQRLLQNEFDVTPLVSVTVLAPPQGR